MTNADLGAVSAAPTGVPGNGSRVAYALREEQEEVAMAVQEAEREAAQLLTSWWTNAERSLPLPVDPKDLAEGLGIVVQDEWLPADESGNIVIPANGTAVISLNMFDHENRRRFTCAHEIGHYVRRRGAGRARQAQTFVDYRDTLAGLGRDIEEIFANQFAAALLMPAHLVQQGHLQELSVERLAARFQVSTQAMDVRLRNLRLI